MQALATIPQHWLVQTQTQRGLPQPAVRQKEFGVWNRWTWDAEFAQVRDLALGLTTLGLQRGDRVVIIGDNDCMYLWATLALLAVGATVVGVPSDATPDEARYVIAHAAAALVFASDQEQCDKLLALKPDLPQITQVIYWKERGMWLYADPWLLAFSALQERGRALQADNPDQLTAIIQAGAGEDVALLCYTAGVAGPPKAVLLSHANILAATRAFAANDPRSTQDNYLSFVPLTTANGAMFELAAHALDGVILNFAEKPETVPQNLREIAPDALLYPARLWENLAATIQLAMLDASWINRRIYRACVDTAGDGGLMRAFGKPLLLRPLLSQLGLHRARSVYTTGGPLDPKVMGFFRSLGLPLRQLYSASEMAGGAIAQQSEPVDLSSVGAPLPGIEVTIAPDGELWLAGPSVCVGYYKADPAQEAALHTDAEGRRWFRTGDAGHMQDGALVYHDRQTDIITLNNGTAFAPQTIEGPLKWNPFISQALIVGDATRPWLTALIVIDPARVGRWAVERGLAYAGLSALAQLPEVYELLRGEICAINRTLPEGARIRRFIVLPRIWSADAGELTRSFKLRRRVIAERNAPLIAALYADQASVADPSDGTSLRIGRCNETPI